MAATRDSGRWLDGARPTRGRRRFDGEGGEVEGLARHFERPDPRGLLRPLWFWNARLDAEAVRWQLRQMHDQHLRGFYIHCRSGLEPKYLSEAWWDLVAVTVSESAQLGMEVGFVDEFNWPSGESRDHTVTGTASRVLGAHPEYRMRSLVPGRIAVAAGQRYHLEPDDVLVAVAAPAGETPRRECLTDVTAAAAGGGWRAPTGDDWLVHEFSLRHTSGFDGGNVDLLDPRAVDAYIDAFYGELVRRFPDDLGTTIVGTFCDHEGDYGHRLAWTPALFDEFARRKGERLEPLLPLLLDSSSPDGPEVRQAWFDVVSDLYAESFFGRVTSFAERHGLTVTGHVWEESLLASAAYQGHAYKVQRAWTFPGIDSLAEWGRHPRHFKEAGTVAHVEGVPLVVEQQGVQGAGSYLSPERVRRLTDTLVLWGGGILCPHALNANPLRTDFPEDWFVSQPWWPAFGQLTDYIARAAAINHCGRHVAQVLLYHPIPSVWAAGDPCFSDAWDYTPARFDWSRGPEFEWGNAADEVESTYARIIEGMAGQGLDFDVTDDDYLARTSVARGRLALGEEDYQVLVVPHLTVWTGQLVESLERLIGGGATVVLVGGPPPEDVLRRLQGGHAARVITVDSVEELATTLDELVSRDWRLPEGAGRLFCTGRAVGGQRLYWLVNDNDEPFEGRVWLCGGGALQEWSVEDGRRTRVAAEVEGDGVGVHVRLDPRHGTLLVLGQDLPTPSRAAGGALTQPRDPGVLDVTAGWVIEAEPGIRAVAAWGTGEGGPVWLGAGRLALRDWHVIGPFDNHWDLGWHTVYPPECSVRLEETYSGKDGRAVAWKLVRSDHRVVDLGSSLGLGTSSWTKDREWTSYAHTWIWSPLERDAELRVVADSGAKAWFQGGLVLDNKDDHPGYLEMHDGFAQRATVRLQAGWNELLLKVSQGHRLGGRYGFSARLCERDGRAIAGVVAEPLRQARFRDPLAGTTVRIPVPAGTRAIHVPGLGMASEAVVAGRRLRPRDGVITVERPPARDDDAPLRIGQGEALLDRPELEVGPARRDLGNLASTAWRFTSGAFVYTRDLDLDSDADRWRWLDLGQVGVVATLTVNGTGVGTRPWPPYRFDVGGLLRPGGNSIEVRVANTRANARAQEDDENQLEVVAFVSQGLRLLPEIDLDGLHGPVTLSAG